ncbi:MAG: OmpA family protein, partial [Desulfobacterales bacterium]|nr:OmpA family protein [Desulfobacterales bacterium]
GDLDTLRIGSDRSVWVEKGEHAFLAAVIRGTPPLELRTFYKETVEDVHLKAGAALAFFDGDTQPFALFRETLNTGLRFQEREDKQQISPVVWLIVALIVTAAIALPVYWGYRVNEARQEWEGRLAKIRDQKGVIVVSVDRDDGVYRLNGLKDPLVTDPLTVLAPEERSDIRVRWQPFYSLDPAFVFQRTEKLLAPPTGVVLSLEQNTLTAKGEADFAWINTFKTRATAIPGIDAADGSALVNTDRTALLTALNTLTSLKIYFENDSAEMIPGQEDNLNRMIDTIRRLNRQMTILNLSVPVTIVGHADSSGTEKYNLKLSRERAEKIYGFVKSRGLSYGFISTLGVGNQVRLKEETGEEDRQFNRAVSFRAEIPSQNDSGATP